VGVECVRCDEAEEGVEATLMDEVGDEDGGGGLATQELQGLEAIQALAPVAAADLLQTATHLDLGFEAECEDSIGT
jgi:hypothetical protein